MVPIDVGGGFEKPLHGDFEGDDLGVNEAREKREAVVQRLAEEHPHADQLRPEVLSILAIFLLDLLVILLTFRSAASIGWRQVTLGTGFNRICSYEE